MKFKAGFTLTEMLIVIAIIGILSAMVIVGIDSYRASARDARRITDLDAIKKAVLLYGDMKGNYIIKYKTATGEEKTNSQAVTDGSWGWINCGDIAGDPGYYQKSIAQGLESWELIGKAPVDIGVRCDTGLYKGYAYERPGAATDKFCLYAKLEKKQGSGNWDTRGMTSVGTDSEWWRTNYGVNYATGIGC